MSTMVIRSRQVVIGGELRPAAISVCDGLITAIESYEAAPTGIAVTDFGQSILMPGLVDTHVHINEPGRADWEGFASATRAAAAGGVTTLIEMPLNSIPATTRVAAYEEKVAAAHGQLAVDVGFWGGLVPGNTAELQALYEAGVFGFKCFLVSSGVPEFEAIDERELRGALPVLSKLGAVLLVHSELPGPIDDAVRGSSHSDPRQYSTWLRSRPRAAENEAIALLIRLCGEFQTFVHVVHLSSSDALPCLHRARSQGVKITVETCPHYLSFAAEEIADGATKFKCAPPIRERANRERLWEALAQGTIDLVASDHSPCPPEMKCSTTGDFMRAWGGIASLELTLPVMWTHARGRGVQIPQLARWLCEAPARLARLERKGVIAIGNDADFVVWDPDAGFTVEPSALHHRHPLTPYAGRTLQGIVRATFVRGMQIYEQGQFLMTTSGRILRRGDA